MRKGRGCRIAVLTDIHGCAAQYADALRQARASKPDATLILGDLLTYGTEPRRVLDLTAEAVDRDGAVLILGNHDQIYIDQEAGGSSYEQALPDWIRESVDWTRHQLGHIRLSAAFDWQASWSHQQLYAAHANPFDYGDWTYLSTPSTMQAAAERLQARGFSAGVFGHSHRHRLYEAAPIGVKLATVGSLGQPRDKRDLLASWSLVSTDGSDFEVQRQPLASDWDAHLAAIRATNLSETTKAKLCGFFAQD